MIWEFHFVLYLNLSGREQWFSIGYQDQSQTMVMMYELSQTQSTLLTTDPWGYPTKIHYIRGLVKLSFQTTSAFSLVHCLTYLLAYWLEFCSIEQHTFDLHKHL